jgi:hypothetical protein
MIEREILQLHNVLVAGDNAWQRRARLAQALWRESAGLPAGEHRGQPLGSRLTLTDGHPPNLANYLTQAAKNQVEAAVKAAPATGALLGRPRLWVDLLSSQPLCFNLFGPLAEDLDLASAALHAVWPEMITAVTDIRFEWSPGRGDMRYTGNNSAFDVFVSYTGPGGKGFLGIEVKYHENLSGRPARDELQRYPAIARKHAIFSDDAIPELQRLPLQQLWLDHLLALQLGTNPGHTDDWDEGTFVLLYPDGNTHCAKAERRYRDCLTDPSSFDARHLEDVVRAIRSVTGNGWIDAVHDRYFEPAHIRNAGMP